MDLTIEPQEALDALRHVVSEKGEAYVDPFSGVHNVGCKYIRPGTEVPGCIIGCALAHLGVSADVLADMDGVDDPIIEMGGVRVLRESDVALHPHAISMFTAAQRVQDAGGPWGDSLREAEKLAHTLKVAT